MTTPDIPDFTRGESLPTADGSTVPQNIAKIDALSADFADWVKSVVQDYAAYVGDVAALTDALALKADLDPVTHEVVDAQIPPAAAGGVDSVQGKTGTITDLGPASLSPAGAPQSDVDALRTTRVHVALTTTRNAANGDLGKTLVYSGSGAVVLTIPTGLTADGEFDVLNLGTGTVTVQAGASATLDPGAIVISQNRGFAFQQASSNVWYVDGLPVDSDPIPSDYGLVAWSCRTREINTVGQVTSGTTIFARMRVPVTTTVTSLDFWCTVAGAGLTYARAALCLTDGTLIGTSGDQITAFQSTGRIKPTLTVVGGQSLTIPGGTDIVGAALFVGTTMPTLGRLSGNLGTALENDFQMMFGSQSGQTTFPTPPTKCTIGKSGNMYYMGLR